MAERPAQLLCDLEGVAAAGLVGVDRSDASDQCSIDSEPGEARQPPPVAVQPLIRGPSEAPGSFPGLRRVERAIR